MPPFIVWVGKRFKRSNAKISHGEGSHDMGQWEKQLRCLMLWGKYLQK